MLPDTVVQTCIVHLIRYFTLFASWKERKAISKALKPARNKGHFPSDDAATKLIYLVLRKIEAKWKRPPKERHAAKPQLAIQFGKQFSPED